jgi:hypothetical protein
MNEADYIEYLTSKYETQPIIFYPFRREITNSEKKVRSKRFIPSDFGFEQGEFCVKQVIPNPSR